MRIHAPASLPLGNGPISPVPTVEGNGWDSDAILASCRTEKVLPMSEIAPQFLGHPDGGLVAIPTPPSWLRLINVT